MLVNRLMVGCFFKGLRCISQAYRSLTIERRTLMSEKNYTPEDIEKNKVVAAIAYAIFFIPLLVDKDSEFGKFHANQGLLLLIISLVGNAVLTISIVGILLLPVLNVLLLVLFLMGVINALNGAAKDLPVIGKYRLLK
jgi:uncharacterized membrane protein